MLLVAYMKLNCKLFFHFLIFTTIFAYMKLITVYKYASLCGITTQAIYKRKKEGKFKTVKRKTPTGEYKEFVDLDKYPAVKRTVKGKTKL
jgi:hypothetical protein